MKCFEDTKKNLTHSFLEINEIKKTLDDETIEIAPIIKSNIILMLYNTVEGVFRCMLDELFYYISDNHILWKDLNAKLKCLYSKYFLKYIGQDKAKFLKILDESNPNWGVTFKDIDKYLNVFSGNLDAKKIREISLEMGINIPRNLGIHLCCIKNWRNQLAHGEKVFSSIGQNITTQELEDVINDVHDYFKDIVIPEYSKFLQNGL